MRTDSIANPAPNTNAESPSAPPRRRRHFPLAIVSAAVAVLFSVPVLGVLGNLVREGQGNWPHLVATVLPDYVLNSLALMLGVGAGVVVAGTGTAWLVVMCRFPGRRLFEWMLVLPLAIPAYVVAYAYTDMLQHAGPVQTLLREAAGWGPRDYWFPNIRSTGGAILVFSAVLYPYVYLLARTAFLQQSICALEVGRTLGRTPWGAFASIALPLARPAIVTGMALALMETLADFGTVAHFGVPTFTTGIYRTWYSMGDRVAAAQLASVLLAFVFALLMLEQWSRWRARFHETSARWQEIKPYRLAGWRAWGAMAFCAGPLVVGFVAPVSMLLWMAAGGGHPLTARYLELTANSATLASITAVLAVMLALFLAYVARIERSQLAAAANRVASLGYAVPGSVIAVGILIPVATLDNAIDNFFRSTFGFGVGLIFTGGIAALIFAYLVRFLAVSFNTVQASLGKVTTHMDDVARSLGHGPLGTALRVHIPVISGGLLTAGLIVFVDVFKELPATLIMRPFNFDTLAVQAYNLAKDERLTQAATPSLIIVACGLLPVFLLSRQIMASRPGSRRKREKAREAVETGTPVWPAG
jgi:iron(III) transport system permease protein